MNGPACQFCGCTEWSIEKEDCIEGYHPTNYDANNGPWYFARCDRCSAQGPAVGFAADALPILAVRGEKQYFEFVRSSTEHEHRIKDDD